MRGAHVSHTVDLSDGGEGSLESLGGANRWSVVTGPLGDPVQAGWRLDGEVAYIEMAASSGLAVVGGADKNDALAADTYGTGELIALAHAAGASEITVFLGGSATTDGGLGALRAMPLPPRMATTSITVAADVETRFVDAATVFGPQKGASPAQVALLTRRLERLVGIYSDRYGVDVSAVPGAGAAGGLAGGLVAAGGDIVSGFDVLAEATRLDEMLSHVDVVFTGEGFCDEQSFNGKVLGGVREWAYRSDTPVVAVVGDSDLEPHQIPDGIRVISLVERFGRDRAMAETVELVVEVVRSELS